MSAPANKKTQARYVDALICEIRRKAPLYKDRRISTIYIGGGTPTILEPELVEKLVCALKGAFDIGNTKAPGGGNVKKVLKQTWRNFTGSYRTDDPVPKLPETEFSIECNPGTVTKEKLKTYRELGINRLSIGLQSAIDEELEALGRIHTVRDFKQTFDAARDAGFDNINIDLMQAIPGQTLDSWRKTLYLISTLAPEHISAYSLIIEEGTPFYGMVNGKEPDKGMSGHLQKNAAGAAKISEAGVLPDEKSGRAVKEDNPLNLPDEDTEREIYYMTREILERSGYYRYEISNYAKPGYECRHNLGYWRRRDYLGLGLGAASLVDNIRWKNCTDLQKYMSYFENETVQDSDFYEEYEVLDKKSQMSEFMFLGLRETAGISVKEFEDTFETSYDRIYGDVTRKMVRDGLMETSDDGRLRLTDRGVDVSNIVFAEYV